MEDQLKEALEKAGMTEEELTANGESKAAKAMEDKAAQAVETNNNETVEETMDKATEEIVNETVETTKNNESKWTAKRILKYVGIGIGCIAAGIGAALLIKSGAAKEAAEAASDTAE